MKVTSKTIIPYSVVGKLLQVPVFRISLGDDLISRVLIFVYNFFSKGCSYRSFDPSIAQRSVDRFEALGAKVTFVTPRDGKGKVQMMSFSAEDLERKINDLGGLWERRSLSCGREVFAIVPPVICTEAWNQFKEKLSHFHWEEKEGYLITCDLAHLISDQEEKRCFLFSHSTSSSFASDWKRAGFYLGAKQDFCFFDNGNTWKNRDRAPSERSFYLEIEAVYEEIKNKYPPEMLWVGGHCGGAPVAAYLKRVLHEEGVNFFAEHSFMDLDDFVDPISSFFAPRVRGCLNTEKLSSNLKSPPPECEFGVKHLWKDLQRYEKARGGRVVIIEVEKDEQLDTSAYKRYVDLAKKVNQHVTHIQYTSVKPNRHSDDFFLYKKAAVSFMEVVFKD